MKNMQYTLVLREMIGQGLEHYLNLVASPVN